MLSDSLPQVNTTHNSTSDLLLITATDCQCRMSLSIANTLRQRGVIILFSCYDLFKPQMYGLCCNLWSADLWHEVIVPRERAMPPQWVCGHFIIVLLRVCYLCYTYVIPQTYHTYNTAQFKCGFFPDAVPHRGSPLKVHAGVKCGCSGFSCSLKHDMTQFILYYIQSP